MRGSAGSVDPDCPCRLRTRPERDGTTPKPNVHPPTAQRARIVCTAQARAHDTNAPHGQGGLIKLGFLEDTSSTQSARATGLKRPVGEARPSRHCSRTRAGLPQSARTEAPECAVGGAVWNAGGGEPSVATDADLAGRRGDEVGVLRCVMSSRCDRCAGTTRICRPLRRGGFRGRTRRTPRMR
jgi:hypothetical protein